jgi:putative intracellular protease/amidase
MNLTIIADTLDPITQKNPNPPANVANSTFGVYFLPTHTFEQAKNLDLDVLIVPGGTGTRAPDPALLSAIEFVRTTYPKVQYLITICTVRTQFLLRFEEWTNK